MKVAKEYMTDPLYFDLLKKDELYRKCATGWVNNHCPFVGEQSRRPAIKQCLEQAYKEWVNTSTDNKKISNLIPENSCKAIESACERCGRGGHYLSECYATYHADGYKI